MRRSGDRDDDLRRVALVGERSSGRTSGPFTDFSLPPELRCWFILSSVTAYATALDGVVAGESLDADLPSAALYDPDLLRRFSAVSDGRGAQGRDHPVAVVLTLCAAAVLAGMRSFTAIAGWVADVPAELLVALHGRPAERGSQSLFPSKSTLWRVLTGLMRLR